MILALGCSFDDRTTSAWIEGLYTQRAADHTHRGGPRHVGALPPLPHPEPNFMRLARGT